MHMQTNVHLTYIREGRIVCFFLTSKARVRKKLQEMAKEIGKNLTARRATSYWRGLAESRVA